MNRIWSWKESLACWKSALLSGAFRREAAFTVVAMALVVHTFGEFVMYVEGRAGVLLADPVLAAFSPVDVTWQTFLLIYACLLVAVLSLTTNPRRLVFAFQCYSVMVLMRLTAMWLLPLDPPAAMIPLRDPFVDFVVGDGSILTRDLFFSGHTSTMFLLFLTATARPLRVWFIAATILVGVCVLIQHVHYTIDVFAAPFFAYGSYRIVKNIHEGFERRRRTTTP